MSRIFPKIFRGGPLFRLVGCAIESFGPAVLLVKILKCFLNPYSWIILERRLGAFTDVVYKRRVRGVAQAGHRQGIRVGSN
jgi:hypothetical protein